MSFLHQVVIAGYPSMGNLTVQVGKALLDILAEDSDEADEFRRFVLGQSTTYYGDSDNWYVDMTLTHARACSSKVYVVVVTCLCKDT